MTDLVADGQCFTTAFLNTVARSKQDGIPLAFGSFCREESQQIQAAADHVIHSRLAR